MVTTLTDFKRQKPPNPTMDEILTTNSWMKDTVLQKFPASAMLKPKNVAYIAPPSCLCPSFSNLCETKFGSLKVLDLCVIQHDFLESRIAS